MTVFEGVADKENKERGMGDMLEIYVDSRLVDLSLNLIFFFSNDYIVSYLIMTSAERLRDL